MNDDLISRSALKKELDNIKQTEYAVKDHQPLFEYIELPDIIKVIDNAPTVITNSVYEAYCAISDEEFEHSDSFWITTPKGKKINFVKERPQGEWIPVKYRPMTVDERKALAEHYGIEYCDTVDEKAFDCPLPEDGQEILVSTSWGVRMDVADNDIDGDGFICYGLEENGDWEGVDAWMPLPEPYKEAEND